MGRQLSKQLLTALIIIILSGLGYGLNQHGELSIPSVPDGSPGTYPVAHVNDGDTIVVRIAGKDETVRLIGIDTPEVKDPRKAVQCFGKAASAKTHELVDGKRVRLEADPESSDRDKYHRLLRYVYLPDGILLNQYLVQQGYAFAYVVFPNSKLEQFRRWEAEARQNSRGLWAGCKVNESTDIKQTNND